ncbi:DUF5610 domain-containing protein [Marinobacter sp. NFXS9]|uniref:DUF5610 domain-containing protein n=1 Tax=Marinobacter sp. NFXS9 TaxID=2818433 RepID=UPI0032DF013F
MVSPVSIPGSDANYRNHSDRPSSASSARGKPAADQSAEGQGRIRTADDAIGVLRARLEQRLQQGLGQGGGQVSKPAADAFEPPSASDVASRVLGFVQNRLEQEARNGADSERLSNLLEQARKGVSQGFSEARDQIEALGMMNDDLSADIDDSFSRIQDGLDGLQQRYLGDGGAGETSSVSGYSVEASSRNQLSFEVRTADGDIVTVAMDETRYAGASSRTEQGNGGTSGESASASLFAGRYRFSVQGELDDGERQALTALFEDVQQVAGRFFDGDVQSAFSAAGQLGLDGEELASFSLNLSSVRTVRASAYEAVSGKPSTNSQLRPLAGLAQGVQSLAGKAAGQGLDSGSLESLMDRMISDLQDGRPDALESDNAGLMTDFWKAIIGALEPTGSETDQEGQGASD